ncbi:MAG: retroviral-like aspartic protease, partial [bacterium]|nr:retroviral-like aspartic protease [bacterium]
MRKSKVTNFVNTKGDIVKVKIGEDLKARAFLDSGAQVCLLTEKYAKLLEGSGLYTRVHWPLPAILADFSIVTYNEYMPQIPIVFDNQQVLLNLWISPELSDEDLVLSKAAMFNLGF